MVATLNPAPPQPLHDSSGRVFAYFVPAEELERLRSQVERLEAELARARAQRDRLAKDFQEVLETFTPPDPTAEEWQAFENNPGDNSDAMDALIAQLESR